MDIWAACKAGFSPAPLQGTCLRVVESQEQVATSYIVSDLKKQSRLEELLEETKPRLRPEWRTLHYLLVTPFRYPPLEYGSRFGTKHQPSLFYASQAMPTALAEAAYYRLVLWYGMTSPPAEHAISQHTVFEVSYATAAGAALNQPPFSRFRSQLTAPDSYQDSQQLGTSLREAGIKVLEYLSARDTAQGINIALYDPGPFACQAPLSQRDWICETDAEYVTWIARGTNELHTFPVGQFLVEGRFPHPAA